VPNTLYVLYELFLMYVILIGTNQRDILLVTTPRKRQAMWGLKIRVPPAIWTPYSSLSIVPTTSGRRCIKYQRTLMNRPKALPWLCSVCFTTYNTNQLQWVSMYTTLYNGLLKVIDSWVIPSHRHNWIDKVFWMGFFGCLYATRCTGIQQSTAR
jgi:hypothetical protein